MPTIYIYDKSSCVTIHERKQMSCSVAIVVKQSVNQGVSIYL